MKRTLATLFTLIFITLGLLWTFSTHKEPTWDSLSHQQKIFYNQLRSELVSAEIGDYIIFIGKPYEISRRDRLTFTVHLLGTTSLEVHNLALLENLRKCQQHIPQGSRRHEKLKAIYASKP